tara:strand:+ start:5256 stop:8639 length:3384 start_codon:yes stop_codon:yes gene_type:complete
MAKCLEVAFKANVPKPQRRRVVAKTADWTMLEKPWRSLVYIAMEEIEPPGDDDDKPSMSRQHRGSRRRTRGGGAQSPLDWLPSLEDIMLDAEHSEVFRLAVILINKQLKRGDWKEEYGSEENKLRDFCLENGVSETWIKLAKHTPLLGQFESYPISKKKQKKSSKKADLSKARIDINDSGKILESLDNFSSLCEDAETQVALQKVISQIKSRRTLAPSSQLLELKGKASIISVLIALASQKDITKSVKELSKIDSDLASEFTDLSNLINGEVKDWNRTISVKAEDGLSNLRRYLAWQLTPLEQAIKLSSEELSKGIELLKDNSENNSKIEQLTWIYLSALNNEGATEEAKQLLLQQTLDQNANLTELMPVITSIDSNEIYQWLEGQISSLDEASLIEIIKAQGMPKPILKTSLNMLQDQDSEAWEDVVENAVDIYSQTLELERLAKLFSTNPVLVLAHPYEALLVYHLIAAKGDSDLLATTKSARSEALSAIHATQPPEYLSSTSHSLLLMMEGSSVDEESFTILDKRGYQALKSARHSLKEGGSGTISLTNLDHLITSVAQCDLDELETRLFSVLISTLRLNYVRLTLQHGVRNKDNVEILSKLVEGDNIPSRIISSLSQLIFEHDIGLESLVSWYQDNDPLSPWHTVSRAAVSADKSDEINAARDYRRAAEHDEFDFEHSLILYRKALIHLAHAGQWSEAVNLLEQQPALKTAITQRFQLYLNVSYTANQQSTDKATQMLKNFVRRTRLVQEENEEGEMIEKERVYFAEDELDLLRSYPFEHRRTLPHEPFSGRVTAAINTVHKSRRRNRRSYDMQFMTIMQQSSPLPIEVYDLAKEAAESNPVEGLMFFERAQNSGKFSLRDSKTLADSETSLFAKYKYQITNSSRRYLKHLSLPPLVIVDTNLLVDALVEKISQQLELASETSLDLSEQNSFHKVLVSRARDGKISMWLPQIVRHELQEIGKGVSKLRDKFKNSLVRPEILDKVVKQENLSKLVDEVISDFNQWKPLDIRLEEDSNSSENKEQIKQFLQDYRDIYDELTAMKKAHGGKQKRTKIGGKEIYPEAPDRVIMMICIHLAKQCLEGLGTVLVATRDGDFTLTARAFEERFGFGVVKNSRMLNAWLEI